jgi:hypothetical protein
MGEGAKDLYNDLFKSPPALAGMDAQGFVPEMRVRVMDPFSSKVNATVGDPSPIIAIPSMSLDKNKNEAGDAGLLSVSITRARGVGTGNQATLTFANKNGMLYRRNAGQGDVPTLDEETLLEKGRPTLPKAVVTYLARVANKNLIGADINPERQQAILDFRSEVRRLGGKDPFQSDALLKALDRIIRTDVLFEEMAPIEIDMKDVKGRWFGVFTGFISSVQDEYTPGQVPHVTVVALDKMSLLAKSYVIVQRTLLDLSKKTKSEKIAGRVPEPNLKDSDRYALFQGPKVFEALVQQVNATFTAQGYFQMLAEGGPQYSGGGTPDGISFLSEIYNCHPTWIRAGVSPDGTTSATTRVTNLAEKSNKVTSVHVGGSNSVEETPTRFWTFRAGVMSNAALGKDDVLLKHARPFRIWTFPNRVGSLPVPAPDVDENGVKTEFKVGKDGKLDPSAVHLSWQDYRGLSTYWPFHTIDSSGWGTSDERKPFPQVGFKDSDSLFARSFDKAFKTDLGTSDASVPFRLSGIAQFDQIFYPIRNGAPGGRTFPTIVTKTAQAVLRSSWFQVLNSNVPVTEKMANLEQATLMDIYTNGLGDLVFAAPRWNQVPVPEFDSIEAGPDFTLLSDSEAAVLGVDRKDLYHGREYILSDFGLTSRTLNRTEDGKVDRVSVQGLTDYLQMGPIYQQTQMMGQSVGLDTFQALYGNRDFAVQQAVPLDGRVLGPALKTQLEHFASAVKTNLTFRGNTLDVTYKIPRPVELCRTVLLPDNFWLYYVTSITRSWSVGQDYQESYHCEYGHPVWYHLPIPWVTLVNDVARSLEDLQNTRTDATRTVGGKIKPVATESTNGLGDTLGDGETGVNTSGIRTYGPIQ